MINEYGKSFSIIYHYIIFILIIYQIFLNKNVIRLNLFNIKININSFNKIFSLSIFELYFQFVFLNIN